MTAAPLIVALAVAAVVVLSRRLSARSGLPYPVFLVVAGAAASFVPRMPEVRLDPSLVFLVFLPPLVYHAGFVTSPRELRAHARPIALSALGLVLATTFGVAGAVWAVVPHLGWVSAFVLGAIVAPTDPVAATSVLDRLGGPPRVTTVLEGESLVNDGIALSLFGLGIAAVAHPTGVGGGVLTFLRVAGGGTAFGLAVGWAASQVRRPLQDGASQLVVSLLVPFVSYLPADALGLSGVLAALTTGLFLGQRPVAAVGPSARLRVVEFWEVLVFLLESVLFVLVGLQFRYVLAGIRGYPATDVAALVAVSVAAVIGVRILWQLAIPTVRWRPEGRLVDTGAVPWQERLALGWSGLRGAISLAAALSVPLTAAGRSFPGRNLLLFATFCVILATLAGQGLTLPWLLRHLGLVGSDVEQREHTLAHRRCIEAALRRLDELVADEEVGDDVAEILRAVHERRLGRLRRQLDGADGEEEPAGAGGPSVEEVQRMLLRTQHRVLAELHREGVISFAVLRDVRRELDLEQASLEA